MSKFPEWVGHIGGGKNEAVRTAECHPFVARVPACRKDGLSSAYVYFIVLAL